ATTVLVLTGVISAGTWLTPRMVPNEVLSEAHSEAQQERTVAAALADTDAQHTTDDNQQRDSDATLTQLTGNSAVADVQQQALPATAFDSAPAAVHARVLVITRTSEGIRTHLISGAGTMLDDMTGTWTSRTVAGGLFSPQAAPADEAD